MGRPGPAGGATAAVGRYARGMLTLSGVAARHGQDTLFTDVTLQLTPSRRVGLVGPNGSGKTTLLRIVAGDREADGGEVNRAKGTVVGYLRQDVAETRGRSVLDEAIAAAGDVTALERRLRELEQQIADAGERGEAPEELLAAYARAQETFELRGGYELEARARKVLAGLGFGEEEMGRDVGTMSGGWMMRVALARLLLSAPDVLLLDEPTNHLDLDSVRWLEQFVASYPGAVLCVSHDRDFLDATCNRIAELAEGTLTEYVGDYEAFVAERELRREQRRKAARNQQRKLAQDQRFVDRFRYKASKAKQVQSRIKMMERTERITEPADDQPRFAFRFPEPPRSGRDVVKLEGVAKAYGEHTVYDGLDLVLERGQKVALVGPNGAGKSTLLKLLAGALDPDAGQRVYGHNVRVAYYAQHALDHLTPALTALEEVSATVDTSQVNPRSVLGAFLFRGEEADKRVGVLSGGEKARLALAKLMSDPVNLLCMDEPTNHLDVAARDVVEEALVAYPGTVVLITHDRHLIRSVADAIVEVRDGDAVLHRLSYEEYLEREGAEGAAGMEATHATTPSPARRPAGGRDDEAARKRAEAEARNRRYRATKDLRARLSELEAELETAEAEERRLERELADPEVYEDGARVRELTTAHHLARDRVAGLLEAWEETAQRLEAAEAEAEGGTGDERTGAGART